MGERIPIHNDQHDAEIISFPSETVTLREINDSSIGDSELSAIVDTAVDRKDVLNQEEEVRARYILRSMLDALNITGDMGTFFDENNVPLPERKADMQHTADVSHRIKNAQLWYTWHKDQFGARETGEKLLEDIELINQDWQPTNLYRAFKVLAEKIRVNRADQFANAVIAANRLAIIMMAQATSGYTKTSEG